MNSSSVDLLVRLFLLVFVGLGIGVGTVLALDAEYVSLQNVLTGDVVVGLWFAVLGTFALFLVVYLAGYRHFVPMVRQFVMDLSNVPVEP